MKRFAFAALTLLGIVGPVMADDFEMYREMMADDNPAELWQTKGEEIWKARRGPRQVSLETCDLGLGPGAIKGAYARLPRYFKDTGEVQDLESRLVTCMMKVQGMSREEAEKNHYSKDGNSSDIEALSTYIAAASAGMTIDPPQDHPKEKEAYAVGEKLFYYRAGPHDFACSTCHNQTGLRIRLQTLPNLAKPGADAQKVYAAYPAYRVSQGTVRTMENRLYDCLRQQRMPEPAYLSAVMIDLTEFLAVNAKGGQMAAPGLKR